MENLFLNWIFNVPYFRIKFLLSFSFWRKKCYQKITIWLILLRQKDVFPTFGAFLKLTFLEQNFLFDNKLVFESTNLQPVNFWIESFTTSHILDQLLQIVSDFEINVLQSVWLRITFFSRSSSLHPFIEKGYFSAMF